MIKGINDQEKAALYFHIFERCEDWQRVFKIAIGAERFNSLTDKAKQTSASRWKNSASVQLSLKEIKDAVKAKEEQIKEECKREERNSEEPEPSERGAKRTKSETDFLNRDEFLKFLNTRANEIQDDKLRNDILKMLSDNLRYKESDRDNDNEIQRFYTPQICKDCTIYKKCGSCAVRECPNV